MHTTVNISDVKWSEKNYPHSLLITQQGDGTGVCSIYGETDFADENFNHKHVSAGVLSMVSFALLYLMFWHKASLTSNI